MCKECGIRGYITNHSLRATAASRLYASGMDEQLVMERTGHKSVHLQAYFYAAKKVSETLNRVKKIKHVIPLPIQKATSTILLWLMFHVLVTTHLRAEPSIFTLVTISI